MKKCFAFICLFLLICTSSANTETSSLNFEFVTLRELMDELEIIAQSIESSQILKDEFKQLQQSHGVVGDDNTYKNFVRVRLAFEATRDSGLWQIRWAITNNEPFSSLIWDQLQKQTAPKFENEKTALATATAECDELSALFAFVARGLGVKKVGLFWPTYNHTVAVWTTMDKHGKSVRVVVPTSQVFISADATLGTKEFDPNKQKTIYDYSRQDVPPNYKIHAPLARMMIIQVKNYATKPAAFLQARRNRLSKKINGS